MKINLTAIFSHPSAITNKTSYARVDNTSSPVWIPGPDVSSSPATISPIGGVDNGVWRVRITPVYTDQRSCGATEYETPSCSPVTTFNAIVQGSDIIVSYNAPGEIPKVRLLINYPNGGSFSQLYTNGSNGSTITVPLPAGLIGDISVYMQTVCDEETGFYSQLSQPVVITYNPQVIITSGIEVLCDTYLGPNPSNRGLRYHKLRFNLPQPLSAPLELSAAFTTLIPVGGQGYPGETFGYSILPDGVYEKSLNANNVYGAYNFTIPAGVSTYTTNTLEFASGTSPRNPPTDVVICFGNSSQIDYVSEKLFLRVNNIPNVQLNISSITNSTTVPITFTQIPS